MLSSHEIRQQFIDFFVQRQGHTFVPSSPVVPHDDATLLFANAGMNQFKDVFLGTGSRPYRRAANTQKCIRAGGKHNDLEDVGKDTYHHTFFEMLGNWSFGDYFKKEAIGWAWELLTKQWGLDKTRLHATVFGGDQAEGLEPDHEAAELWKTVTDINPAHIHFGNKKDNFWEMGDSGPCGPCSEIHIDRTPDKSGAKLVNAGDARVMEIWNLVFIQFNRAPAPGGSNGQLGKLTPLPAKHVDTGMGFERVCSVLQGKSSNYDTDVFTPIFAAIREVTKARAYGGALEDRVDIAYRVLADHLRCLTFAITDGAVPSNEGRGYVLRRILRRAVRHGRQTLGMHEPFLHKLVPALVGGMGAAFPELKKNPQHVIDVIKEEEESFGRTIDRGIELFEQAVVEACGLEHAKATSSPFLNSVFGDTWLPPGLESSPKNEVHVTNAVTPFSTKINLDDAGSIEKYCTTYKVKRENIKISSKAAFRLHDTYGFPLDLTQVMAEERGMTVDVEGFGQLMEQAREISRGGGGANDPKESLVNIVQQEKLEATEFVGYDHMDLVTSTPCRLYAVTDAHPAAYEPLEAAPQGTKVAVVTGKTPFYAESGGQVGDTGVILQGSGTILRVEDTIKVGDVTFHLGRVEMGTFTAAGGMVALTFKIDGERRARIMANHTSTHVLNRALRSLVSATVDQRGSLVDEEKLRFDFSHNSAVTDEQLAAVERQVNADIAADLPVYYGYAPQAQALKIKGLRAVFGEKYPPTVRVVSIGVPVEKLLADPGQDEWAGYSVEFCGGTHLARTGDAEGLVILSEESVAKGIRRMTALTGKLAHQAQAQGEMLLARLEALKTAADDKLVQGVAELTTALNAAVLPAVARTRLRVGLGELQKLVKEQRKQQSQASGDQVVEEARKIAEEATGAVIVAQVPGADGQALRTAMDVIRKKLPGAAMLLAAVSGEGEEAKVSFLASVPADLVAKGLKAGDWVREVAAVTGGKGGGRPDMAQAGGKEVAKLAEALKTARDFAGGKIG
ncbi:MAG: alanine--tRNA ligase [Phycisphaeraceae bacterium]|nr:alanine--tRNA ligase [Phycisphaeraceae bacterium]